MAEIVLERLEWPDLPAVEALLEACGEQHRLALGRPPGPGAAEAHCAGLPRGVPRTRKHLLGITDAGTRELMGLIDAVVHFPDAATLTVGLFLISPLHSEGSTPQIARGLLEVWATERWMRHVRVEVSANSWSALQFWQSAGFVAEAAPIRAGRGLVVVFEKQLVCGTSADRELASLRLE
ncbi:MAG: hypothetical protein FJX74_15600 [Armatimonadetes bacterium]|nr:hypothetical protein [Armatimonadota bacterium]